MAQSKAVDVYLNPLNPLDHIRLLQWFFFSPAHLAAYRDEVGRPGVQVVGAWLASTLVWLPTVTLLTGIMLRTLPVTDREFPAIAIIAGIVLGWAITGLMGAREVDNSTGWRASFSEILNTAFIIVFGVAFGVAFGLAFVTALDLAEVVSFPTTFGTTNLVALLGFFGLTFGMGFIIADQVAFGGIFIVAPVLAFVVAFVGVFGIGFVGVFFAMFITVFMGAFMVAFLVAYVVATFIARRIERKTNTVFERIMRVVGLIVLLAAHAGLVWQVILGGWQTLM